MRRNLVQFDHPSAVNRHYVEQTNMSRGFAEGSVMEQNAWEKIIMAGLEHNPFEIAEVEPDEIKQQKLRIRKLRLTLEELNLQSQIKALQESLDHDGPTSGDAT